MTRTGSRLHQHPAALLGYWVNGAAPLAVVTACRYVRDTDQTLTLHRQVTDRTTVAAVTAGHTAPATECVTGPGTAGTVDALVLRDILGQTREARIPRDTCHAATTGLQDAVATAQLLHVTDALLGPPT